MRRHALALRLLPSLLALAAAGGCGKSRTEAVVVVSAAGLRVPDDVDAVHVQIFDAQNPTPPLWDVVYTLCTDSITTGCVTLAPFTLTLVPGTRAPGDSTRIVVSAQRGGVDRIDDAALFSFVSGESLRLDFVLYANCLDKIDCAAINQACGFDRRCTPIHPNPFNGEPDLAQRRGDLGPPVDLAGADLASSDLAGDTDMASSPGDMELDMSGPCVPLCPPNFCGMSNCNTQCGCGTDAVCMSNACVPCGHVHDECCPGNVCKDQSTCGTTSGMCECGGLHQPCCAPDNTCNDLTLGCVPVAGNMQCETMDMGTPPPPQQLLSTWDRQTYAGPMTLGTFNGVSGAGDVIVAVGPSGNIWQRGAVANTFVRMHSSGAGEAAGDFSRVWISSPNHGWAVGSGGLIDYWDGSNWTVTPTAFAAKTPYDYSGVWANGTDAWVSGANALGGIVAHNVSGAWLSATDATPFGGVWSDGSSSALVCATDSNDFVASDNGTAISLTPKSYAGTAALSKKAWGDSLNSAWFVSTQGDIVYYNNGTLTKDLGAQSNIVFNAINGFGSGAAVELWAVGENTLSGRPVLYHAKGPPTGRTAFDNWTAQNNIPSPGGVFNDVVALGPRDLYLVGSEASALIFHAHTP